MPAPSLTEQGKLSSWGLIRHHQQKQSWYIQQGKALVTRAKFGVSTTKTTSGSVYVSAKMKWLRCYVYGLWLILNGRRYYKASRIYR